MAINPTTGNQYADLGAGSDPSKWKTSKSKEKSSFSNIQSAIGEAPAETEYNIGKTKVKVEEKTSYSNVEQARQEELKQRAELGQELSEQQKAELQAIKEYENRQRVSIAIDKEAVDEYNKQMAARNIKNAEDYFNYIRQQQETSPTNSNLGRTPSPSQFIAPRKISPEETTSLTPTTQLGNGVIPDYELVKYKLPQPPSRPPGINEFGFWEKGFETQREKIESKSQSLINQLKEYENMGANVNLAIIGIRYVEGVAKGPSTIGAVALAVAKEPFSAPTDIVAGSMQFVSEATSDLATGNLPELAAKIGEATYLGEATRTIIKEPLRAEARYRAGMEAEGIGFEAVLEPGTEISIWDKATKSTPKATPENPAFKNRGEAYPVEDIIPDKDFTRVPTEYTELANNLQEAKGESIDLSANENLPGTYLEASQNIPLAEGLQKAPELQTRLSKQTPPTRGLSQLTPEELLEQTRTSLSSEQKKLLEYPDTKPQLPPPPPSKPMYAVDPMGAVVISIIEEGPRAYDYLKGKYKTYKEGATIITEEGVKSIKYLPESLPGSTLKTIKDISINPQSPSISSIGTKTPPTTNLNLGSTIINRIKLEEGQRNNPTIISRSSTNTINKESLGEESRTPQIVDTPPIQGQQQGQNQITEQTQSSQQNNIQLLEQDRIPNNPEITYPFKTRKDNYPMATPSPIEIQIRQRGVFKSFGFEPTQEKARIRAEQIVRQTPAASFRLREESGDFLQDTKISQDFTPSKKERGVIIEKSSKRINTPGELSGITFAPRKIGGKRKSIF